jgi:capsular polysaccharide biosynthesis protein
MPENFEMFRFLDHLRGRWRVIAVACGTAAAIALIAAFLTPNRYTSTAHVLIEPPAGSDPRGAMAVSPIYLESLKSYELVASGDRLFLDAIDHFKLPSGGSVERLKRAVLKVTIPRNTKVLEISATLHEPAQAQALALYIAEQTVKLARDVSADTERDLLADAQKELDEAQSRLNGLEGGSATRAPAESASRTAQRDAARAAVYAAVEHLVQVRSTAGGRGERLKIIDSGVVPQQPSWPNIPLMLLVAVLVALVGSLLYLTLEFNYRLERPAAPRTVAPLARVKSRND